MNDLTVKDNNLTIFNSDALEQAFSFAQKISGSGIIPRALQNKPADICITLQTGVELGFSPMVALRSIDVIHSTPAIKPQAMLALIRSRLPKSLVKMEGDAKKATCTIIRDRDFPEDSYTAHWTIERAQTMGLLSKDNWKKQPQTMLMWRAVGEAARFACPDIIGGMYNSFEVNDFDHLDDMYAEPRDIEADIKDHKTQLSKPEDVKSETSKEDIAEAVFKDIGDNQEAVEEANIISQIENRDYIIPIGKYAEKKLYQIPIEELREYEKELNKGFEKMRASKKKATEAQTVLFANITSYVDKYNKIEISNVSDSSSQLDIEVEAKKIQEKEKAAPKKASEASFRLD